MFVEQEPRNSTVSHMGAIWLPNGDFIMSGGRENPAPFFRRVKQGTSNMSRIAKTLVVVFLAALVVSLQAAENLTEEQSLPVHADRDAYTPASAFLKDSYLVVWQSGRLAPGDLRPQKAFLNLSGESQLIAGAYLCWDGSAFVAACTEFLSNGKWIHRGPNQIEGIMVARISPEGQTLAFLLVASGKDVPATNACVASDRAGTSLIAYEKQHATPEKPIEIGYRILTAK